MTSKEIFAGLLFLIDGAVPIGAFVISKWITKNDDGRRVYYTYFLGIFISILILGEIERYSIQQPVELYFASFIMSHIPMIRFLILKKMR